MKLNDYNLFQDLDKSNMLGEIKNLPDQLEKAWMIANDFPLPKKQTYTNIIIAGMGGSAIGADILLSYVNSMCVLPITVIRGYNLPGWAVGEHVLVICSSHSGNTEETIAVMDHAFKNHCTILSLSTGGRLDEFSRENGGIAWRFDHEGQPRAAVGYSFGLLLNLFSRMAWIQDQTQVLNNAVESMKKFMPSITEDKPITQNMAKRIAGQAIDRFPIIFAAEHLEPVGRRWKTQFNELAKCLANFEFIPEANHNTLAGLVYPETEQHKFYSLFLDSDFYNPQNVKRMQITCTEFLVGGFCTDLIKINSLEKLSEIWQLILLGDFLAYYLAMAYGVDPTQVQALEDFKKSIKE